MPSARARRAVARDQRPEPIKLDLFPQQRAFVEDLSPTSVAITGIGGAKTKSGAIKVVLACLAFPGMTWLVTAPTFDQLTNGPILSLIEILEPMGLLDQHHEQKRVLYLTNGGEIHYRSAEIPANLRGPEYHGGWMDEAGYCSRDAYMTFIGRIRKPGLGINPKIYTSTPAGMNWFHDAFYLRGAEPFTDDPTGDHSFIRRFSTTGIATHRWWTHDNPYLPPDVVAEWEREYGGSDLYVQELQGDFVTFEGLVYRVPPSALVDFYPSPPYVRAVGGVDFGSTSRYAHATAAHVVVEDQAGRAWMVDEFYARPVKENELETWMARATLRWGVQQWEADRSQFHAIGMMSAGGIPIRPTPPPSEVSVLDGITIVQRRLATGGLFVVRQACPQWVRGVRKYAWKEPKPGQVAPREPVKVDDDMMDSSRYGIVCLDRAFHAPDDFGQIAVVWDGEEREDLPAWLQRELEDQPDGPIIEGLGYGWVDSPHEEVPRWS